MRKKLNRKAKTKSTSDEDSSEGYSEEDNRRAISRRAATTVSYKEDSEDKTDSEDLLEVEAPTEPVELDEEKCETIEKVLAQRRGWKGGKKNAFTALVKIRHPIMHRLEFILMVFHFSSDWQ